MVAVISGSHVTNAKYLFQKNFLSLGVCAVYVGFVCRVVRKIVCMREKDLYYVEL